MVRVEHLRSLLQDYIAADAREAEFVQQMSGLAQSVSDPLSSDHYVPGHFTASAFVLSPAGDEVLLILHSKFQRWLQPGGHIEPTDADVVQAALREVREETGLLNLRVDAHALFDVDIHAIPARGVKPQHLHFDLRFLLHAADKEFQAGSDAQAARWVPLEQVSALESDESVLRAVRKLRKQR